MQLSRARRLSSPSTTYQGASGNVGVDEHLVLRLRVLDPAGARVQVHRRELPAAQRILEPRAEAPLLLLVGHREPVLDEPDSVLDEQPLEDRALREEAAVLVRRAEAHHVLDAGPVVPAPVEDRDLARGRQLGDVALEVPLAALALGRRGQSDDPRHARVEVLGDPLDHAALACGVAALEDDDEPLALRPHPLLQLHELRLEALELALVELARDLRGVVVLHAREPTPR